MNRNQTNDITIITILLLLILLLLLSKKISFIILLFNYYFKVNIKYMIILKLHLRTTI